MSFFLERLALESCKGSKALTFLIAFLHSFCNSFQVSNLHEQGQQVTTPHPSTLQSQGFHLLGCPQTTAAADLVCLAPCDAKGSQTGTQDLQEAGRCNGKLIGKLFLERIDLLELESQLIDYCTRHHRCIILRILELMADFNPLHRR